MPVFYTKIGDHFIRISTRSEWIVSALAKDFSVLSPFEQADIQLQIEEGYGTPFQHYDVDVQKKQNTLYFTRADYQIQAQPDFKKASLFVHDELALKHSFMNFYSSYIVHCRWGLMIHSSCVVDNEAAHLFSGQSGAGKSTAARLSEPRALLSDEATLIKVTKEAAIVYNSPFRSELKADSEQKPVPLGSVQLLHQSLDIKRVAKKKSDALIHLMGNVFYWPYEKEEASVILFLLKRLVEHSEVHDLYFQKNNLFWELISS